MPDEIPSDAHAMIIGAMKCGTSSLFHYLADHPEICPACTKEPEFFSENQDHGVDVERYSNLFSFDRSTHKYTLDGSTGYTKYPMEPNVPRNMFEYGLSPRFIYIIRNPFERIPSHFNFMQRNAKWSLDMLDDHLINTCNYYVQLEQYRRYFPISRMLILAFDDLKCNPHRLLEKICDFLGLSRSHIPATYRARNPTRPVSNLEKRIRSLGIDPLLRPLPEAPKRVLGSLLGRLLPAEKRELTEAEREFIHRRLRESMVGLNEVYGFDTTRWGFSS